MKVKTVESPSSPASPDKRLYGYPREGNTDQESETVRKQKQLRLFGAEVHQSPSAASAASKPVETVELRLLDEAP
eukprot:4186554-Karenia_brevis.AAC.1